MILLFLFFSRLYFPYESTRAPLTRSRTHRKPVPFLKNQYRVHGAFHPSSTVTRWLAVVVLSAAVRVAQVRHDVCCPHTDVVSPPSVALSSRSCPVPVTASSAIIVCVRCTVCPSPCVVCAYRRNMPGRCRGISDGCSASNRIRPRRCRPSTSHAAGPWTVEIPSISSSTTTICSRPPPPWPRRLFIWPLYSQPLSHSHLSGCP